MLGFLSAIDIAAQIRSRQLSALECVTYFQKRVAQHNSKLNAIVVFDWERAMARAQQADAALARGESWGPFHGVPITVKESFDLKGHATTWGDPAFIHDIAATDDLAVQRLERSGAIVFGKTNVPLRLMDIQTFNEIYGVTHNPWDISRSPGGSSGGAAAALAAGLTGLELGTDIGGSIRSPAHYCGVYGHKPTFNLVGATRSAPPGNLTITDLNVCGPLARSADDLAVAMRYLAAPHLLESAGWHATLAEPIKSLRDYRVVIWPSDARVAVEAEISDRCQRLADRLAKLGATVSDTARPGFDVTRANTVYKKLLEAATHPRTALPHSEWLALNHERTQIRLQWRDFFKDWDVVICPVAATAAFPHDHRPMSDRRLDVDGQSVAAFQQLFWAGLVTLSYLPSTAFPTGPNKRGLPIGLQVFGNAYHDLLTIDFARQLGDVIGTFNAPPGFAD